LQKRSGKNLIPDRVLYPVGCAGNVGAVHPREEEAEQAVVGKGEIVLFIESILQIVIDFVAGVQFKKIRASFAPWLNDSTPPPMVGKTLLQNNLLPFAAPAPWPVKMLGVKWISPVQKYAFYIIASQQVDGQLVRIERITKIVSALMKYSCKIHGNNPFLFDEIYFYEPLYHNIEQIESQKYRYNH